MLMLLYLGTFKVDLKIRENYTFIAVFNHAYTQLDILSFWARDGLSHRNEFFCFLFWVLKIIYQWRKRARRSKNEIKRE